jgi:hypothetical protein
MVRVRKGNETERTISRRKLAGRVKENWSGPEIIAQVIWEKFMTCGVSRVWGAPLDAVVIRPLTPRVAIWQQRNL